MNARYVWLSWWAFWFISTIELMAFGLFSADFMHNKHFHRCIICYFEIYLIFAPCSHSLASFRSVLPVKSLLGFIVKVDQTCCNNPECVKRNERKWMEIHWKYPYLKKIFQPNWMKRTLISFSWSLFYFSMWLLLFSMSYYMNIFLFTLSFYRFYILFYMCMCMCQCVCMCSMF